MLSAKPNTRRLSRRRLIDRLLRGSAIKAARGTYATRVFINCPFDGEYQGLFEAIAFAVHDCGFYARCALERLDSGEVRIDKICRLIGACRLGIHDLSRTELDPLHQLPRFNMPFEMGLFVGAQRYGTGIQRDKNCLILDRAPYRYQRFCSDIAGQDPVSHNGDPSRVIRVVRDWLQRYGRTRAPSGSLMVDRYERFRADLPHMCRLGRLREAELTFNDFVYVLSIWLRHVGATDRVYA